MLYAAFDCTPGRAAAGYHRGTRRIASTPPGQVRRYPHNHAAANRSRRSGCAVAGTATKRVRSRMANGTDVITNTNPPNARLSARVQVLSLRGAERRSNLARSSLGPFVRRLDRDCFVAPLLAMTVGPYVNHFAGWYNGPIGWSFPERRNGCRSQRLAAARSSRRGDDPPDQRSMDPKRARKGMVPRGGIEPPTLRFSVACSTN